MIADLPERYRAAAAGVTEEYATQPDVRAVLLAGSVTHGQGGPTSDLDVWIIVDAAFRRRRSLVRAGVPVEIFLNPPARIEQYLAEGDVSALHMTGYGWPVYVRSDAALQVADVQARARACYEAGPAPLNPEAMARQRNLAIDMLFDAEDSVNTDPVGATLAMNDALRQILHLYYARQPAWMPKWKRLPPDLAARHPALAAALHTYLAAPDAPARLTALHGMFAAVLPEGYGLEQWCWESSPQAVSL